MEINNTKRDLQVERLPRTMPLILTPLSHFDLLETWKGKQR